MAVVELLGGAADSGSVIQIDDWFFEGFLDVPGGQSFLVRAFEAELGQAFFHVEEVGGTVKNAKVSAAGGEFSVHDLETLPALRPNAGIGEQTAQLSHIA